jgi:hypothetical protein
LIYATKSASGKSQNEPAMIHLKDSAKIMVTNVTSLLKTVKTVEDEHARGTRALEATIEALHQEIRVSNFLFICFSRLQQSFLLPGKGGGETLWVVLGNLVSFAILTEWLLGVRL